MIQRHFQQKNNKKHHPQIWLPSLTACPHLTAGIQYGCLMYPPKFPPSHLTPADRWLLCPLLQPSPPQRLQRPALQPVQLEGLRGAQAGVQVFEVAGGDDLPQVLLGDGDGG